MTRRNGKSPAGRLRRRVFAALAVAAAAAGAGCSPEAAPAGTLAEALGRFRGAFETGDASRLDGLYPTGWALVAFPGESPGSVSGAALRRRLSRLFRDRAPLAWRERPGSIRQSPDGGYVLFSPDWTSMAIGEDRLLVERFRVGLERVPGAEGDRWRIRELTAWTR